LSRSRRKYGRLRFVCPISRRPIGAPYVITDNRLAELAGWDRELLATELQELVELQFDDIELNALAIDDGGGGAGFASAVLAALHIKHVMDAIERRSSGNAASVLAGLIVDC
jgi:hypothetical protein